LGLLPGFLYRFRRAAIAREGTEVSRPTPAGRVASAADARRTRSSERSRAPAILAGVYEKTGSGKEAMPAERRRLPWGVLVAVAGIAVLAALVFAIGPLRSGVFDAVAGNTGGLRADLRGLGVAGALIAVAVGLVHVVVWYPAEILDAAVGYVYDFWVAMPLIMATWLINAVLAYLIGRHAARPVLHRFISRERFDRFERLAERGGVTLLISMRLVPIVPFSLFSYAAGATRVPLGRFVWTTAIGYLPITAVFVYVGSQLEELSATDPVLWIGALVLIALVVLTARLRRMFFRRERGRGLRQAA
jgi:uncharacterized membrane protein YdjX (TVP38/TMEM64 family)